MQEIFPSLIHQRVVQHIAVFVVVVRVVGVLDVLVRI